MAESSGLPSQASVAPIANQIATGTNAVKQKVAAAILKELATSTPVDTGKARSNWRVGLGGPILDIFPPFSPGHHLGINETENLAATLQVGAEVIVQSKPGQDINITNNVPYIGTLNAGSSSQAPPAFVEKALAAGTAIAGQILRD